MNNSHPLQLGLAVLVAPSGMCVVRCAATCELECSSEVTSVLGFRSVFASRLFRTCNLGTFSPREVTTIRRADGRFSHNSWLLDGVPPGHSWQVDRRRDGSLRPGEGGEQEPDSADAPEGDREDYIREQHAHVLGK